jgi:hypothetical protein
MVPDPKAIINKEFFIMEKKILLFLTFLLTLTVVHSQSLFFGDQHLIFYSKDIAPTSVDVADLDSDGDRDVLSAYDNELIWYENITGQPSFSSKQVITSCAPGSERMIFVQAADIDGDGDQDILSAGCKDSMLVWYENTDGQGAFDAEHELSASSSRAADAVYSADIDGDGDQDVLSISFWDNQIGWYENTDAQGSFGTYQVITSNTKGVKSVSFADMDGDADLDIVAAAYWNNQIVWYENTDGQGSFGSRQIVTTSAVDIGSVNTADMDGDGDQDILSASYGDNKIAWYENTDGQGTFGSQHVITTLATRPLSVYATDLDGDGDNDILSASFLDNRVAWYENTDGNGTFGPQRTITTKGDRPGFVYAGDLDGDGDQDVLSASFDFKIAWYNNTLPMRIVKNPADTSVGVNTRASLKITANAVDHYQWQVDTSKGFFDITDEELYSGIHSNVLEISEAPLALNGYQYRCIISGGSDTLVSGSAELKVAETQPPVLSDVPGDLVLRAESDCKVALPDYTTQVEVTDNADEDPEVTQEPIAGTAISRSTITVTLTATDDAGNSARDSFQVEVVDQSAPVINSTHNDQTLEGGKDCQATLPDYAATVVATDNCYRASELDITQTPAGLTSVSGQSNEVTLTVTDPEGNSNQLSFNVSVEETVKPFISCVEDQQIKLEQGETVYTVSGTEFDPDSIGDNCGVDSVVNSYNQDSTLNGAEFPVDTTTVVWTVTDNSGNQAQCSFEVAVQETVVGMNSLKQNGISFYPNPTTGMLHYESVAQEIRQVQVLDMAGKVLLERKDLPRKGTIDIARLNTGIYHFNIVTAQKVFTVKIMKE